MGRFALIYGLIAGPIIILSMILGIVLSGGEGLGSSLWLGYLIMIVAFSLIFVGIKRYRDQELGGVIKFGQAFLLGLGITAVAGVVYVAAWEVYLNITNYAFINEYAAGIIEKKQAAGVLGEELQAVIADMDKLKEQYANPLFRLPMTFAEVFPIGLIVALVSAAVLRNSKVLPARG
ncbi:MAG: DUF4199 domain-containing protein [Hyphomonadaceae bacterium]